MIVLLFVSLAGLFGLRGSSADPAKSEGNRRSGEAYSVQLNAYADQENAKKFVRLLEKKGYHPYVAAIKKDRVWYKALLGPYPTKAKAMQVVRELEQKDKLKAIVVPAVYPSKEPGGPAGETALPRKKPSKKNTAVKTAVPPAPAEAENRDAKAEPAAQYDSIDVVVSLFLAWVKSWQGKNVETYLAFYSGDFQHRFQSIKQWRGSRRKALAQAGDIKIEFSDIQIVQGHDSVEISFLQKYKSDRVADTGRKTLVWKKDGDSWKIVQETWQAA
ncbi:MAG: SPOR domain-containing protein [Nitrospinae bacterium]|nr:SPOR domain-containing protein [Nitrospinota bacterium]